MSGCGKLGCRWTQNSIVTLLPSVPLSEEREKDKEVGEGGTA